MAGRRKKTPAQKKLSNPRSKADVVQSLPDNAPAMPEYFKNNPALVKVWVEVVTELDRLHVIGKADSGIVEAYCVVFERFRRLQISVTERGESYATKTKDGATRILPNPDVKTLFECIKQMKSLAIELGSTPASRGKVPHLGQGELPLGGAAENPWAKLH